MSEQLKPCPFCGGEASNMHAYGLHERVYCRKCFASTNTSFTDRGKAFAAWNTRTDLSQALVAAKLHEAANDRPPQYAIYGNDRTDAYAKGFCGGVETFRDAILALIDTDHQAALDAVRAEERKRCKPKVKPLVWVDNANDDGRYMTATVSFDREYYIMDYADGTWAWYRGFRGDEKHAGCQEKGLSLDEAKSAAQSDYERRILSALEAGHE